jgi:hypothetical protein
MQTLLGWTNEQLIKQEDELAALVKDAVHFKN